MALLARLKPFNERKGHLTRIYSIDGYRFYAERGWYEVSDALGEKLKGLHQQHYDEESAFLFDVATEDEATKIDEKESEAVAAAKATARSPQKLRQRQTTQVWPVNNAGGVEGIPSGGDTTTLDINAGKVLDTPPPALDDEAETSDIGRATAGKPKTRTRS